MVPERYKVKVFCENCGFKGEVEILKGIRVERQECPNCDCENLILDIPDED